MTEPKKYQLSDEETKNLIGREMALDFIQDLIKRDINMYLYMDIVKRLNLPQNGKYTLSEDRKWLHVTPEETKIITKSNGKKS